MGAERHLPERGWSVLFLHTSCTSSRTAWPVLAPAACLTVPLTTCTLPLLTATSTPLLLVFLRREYDAHAKSCTARKGTSAGD